MTLAIDWKALTKKYADPLAAIDLADFAEATAEDVLKFRTDLHGGMFYAPSDGSVVRVEDKKPKKGKPKEGDDDEEPKGGKNIKHPPAHKPKGREFDYVMSTEKPVGPFGDVLTVKGWQLQDFRKRGGPFLFAHNLDEQLPPIGKVASVKKDLEGTSKTGPFLGGRAEFTPPGLNPFNDLISDAVKSGFMPGGSVGFHMVNPRPPTDEELDADKKLGKFSFISDKTTLIEFSAVPVGMDPDAVTKRTEALGSLEVLLAKWIEEGRYEDDIVAEFRRLMLKGVPTPRGTVWVGDPFVVQIKEDDDDTRTFGHLDDGEVQRIDDDGVDAEMVEDLLSSISTLRADAEEAHRELTVEVGSLRADVETLRAGLNTAVAELQEARALIESLFGDGEGGKDRTATTTDDRDVYGVIFDMPEDDLRAFLKTG